MSITDYVAVVPVAGLLLDDENLDLGSVLLYRDISALRSGDTQSGQGLDGLRASHPDREWPEDVLAVVSVRGDEYGARKLARSRGERALSLVRCFGPYVGPRIGRVAIVGGQATKILDEEDQVVLLAGARSVAHATEPGYWSAHIRWPAGTAERLHARYRACWDALVGCLRSEPDEGGGSRGTRRMMVAAHFIGRSHESRLPADALLYAVVALEALTSFNEPPAELTERVSERSAFLVTDDPTERTAIYERVRAGYKSRSRYVHGDQPTMSDSDAETAAFTALNALAGYVAAGLHALSDDDALAWFDARRFG